MIFTRYAENNFREMIILHADDFGYSRAINQAVMKKINQGLISEVSLIVNMRASKEAIEFLKRNSQVSVNLHLNLVEKFPSQTFYLFPWINRKNLSTFIFVMKIIFKQIKIEDLEKEIESQIEICRLHGVELSGLDSHRHIQIMEPINSLLAKIAKKHSGLKVRNYEQIITFSWPGKLKLLSLKCLRFLTRFIYYQGGQDQKDNSVFSKQKIIFFDWGKEKVGDSFLNLFKKQKIVCIVHPGNIKEEGSF